MDSHVFVFLSQAMYTPFHTPFTHLTIYQTLKKIYYSKEKQKADRVLSMTFFYIQIFCSLVDGSITIFYLQTLFLLADYGSRMRHECPRYGHKDQKRPLLAAGSHCRFVLFFAFSDAKRNIDSYEDNNYLGK